MSARQNSNASDLGEGEGLAAVCYARRVMSAIPASSRWIFWDVTLTPSTSGATPTACSRGSWSAAAWKTWPGSFRRTGSSARSRSLLAPLLALAVASCTSEPTSPVVAPAPEEPLSAEPSPADATVEDQPTLQCPGDTPKAYPWRPPARFEEGACSDDDLEALATALAQKKVNDTADVVRTLSDGCAACAVGRLEDDAWRAIVAGHDGYFGNVGGCVIRLGAEEACGQSVDALSSCLIVGCEACTTRKEQDRCADTLTKPKGACAEMLRAARAECPATALTDAFASSGTCRSMVATIRLFCGS